MARHVVARTDEIPVGSRKVVEIDRRAIVIFHAESGFYALLNRCPHAGAPLDKAACVAHLVPGEPGEFKRTRVGELLRCAWHGWDFDIATGQSYFDPAGTKIRSYPTAVEDGKDLEKGPFIAETFPVTIENSYVVVEA
ncbi:MAG: Rieske (2Fe-2S) protein [Hyphomicrobiaceae bacterium]